MPSFDPQPVPPKKPTPGRPPDGNFFAGMDVAGYPGDLVMQSLIINTNLKWTGFYLTPAPSQGHNLKWMGKHDFLRGLGWGIAPIYVGRQVKSIPNTDHRITRGRVWKFRISRPLWPNEGYRGQDFTGSQSCLEHSGEKPICGYFALVRLDHCIHCQDSCRIVSSGIAVGNGSAQRPAITNLWVADTRRQIGKRRNSRPYEIAAGDLRMTRHRADFQSIALLVNSLQFADAGEVYQV